MEVIEKYASLHSEHKFNATKHESNNLVQQPKIKIEGSNEPTCLHSHEVCIVDGIKREHHLMKQPKIKIENVDKLVCLDSTNLYSSKLEENDTKNQLLSEEYHITFKDEMSEGIDNSVEQQYRNEQSTQNFITQQTRQGILSTMLREAHRILKSKELCNQCRSCGRVFLGSPDYFFFHLLCYHSSAKCLRRNLFNALCYSKKLSIKTILKNTQFKCKRYSKSFVHINKHQKHFCFSTNGDTSCILSNTKTDLAVHMPSHIGKILCKCELCLKQFSFKKSLTAHIRSHTGKKLFKCEVCLKTFYDKSSLKIHMRSHTGETPFKCELCLKQFSHKSYLQIHMRCHTGDKPYKCEICWKQFSQKSNFNSHMRTHTGQKPFKCEICLKQFSQNSSFNRHMRTHTGEKPFKCEICFKSFCDNGSLKIHMRSHTGVKPFKCELCFKQFSRNSSLRIHMRCHSSEKSFK